MPRASGPQQKRPALHHVIDECVALGSSQGVGGEVVDDEEVEGPEHGRRIGELSGGEMDDQRGETGPDDGEAVQRRWLVGDDAGHQARVSVGDARLLARHHVSVLDHTHGHRPGDVLGHIGPDVLGGAARQADRGLVGRRAEGRTSVAGAVVGLDFKRAVNRRAGVGEVDRDRHPLAELDRVVVADLDGDLDGFGGRLRRRRRCTEADRRGETRDARPDSKTPAAACHSNL